jgi:hypothetical protein
MEFMENGSIDRCIGSLSVEQKVLTIVRATLAVDFVHSRRHQTIENFDGRRIQREVVGFWCFTECQRIDDDECWEHDSIRASGGFAGRKADC